MVRPLFLICGFFFVMMTTGCHNDLKTETITIDASAYVTQQPSQTNDNLEKVSDILTKYDCVPVSHGVQAAQLIQVIDGDTIDVSMDGITYRVRYIGINSPEYDEGQGQEATDFNAGLVNGQEIFLVKDVSETDTYGRLLRYVFTEKAFVNEEIVLRGYARKSDYEPDTACSEIFAKAEESAMYASVGIWATSEANSKDMSIQITTVNYHGEAGKNEPDEYVEIQNTGSENVNLGEWYIKDQGKHRFIFSSLTMAPGDICRVYTNEDHPEFCGLSFDLGDSAVWNNDGDCATLYDAKGILIDEFCYPQRKLLTGEFTLLVVGKIEVQKHPYQQV